MRNPAEQREFERRVAADRKQHAAYKANVKPVEQPKKFKAIRASSYQPQHSYYTNYSG